jgi:hypothetical protein
LSAHVADLLARVRARVATAPTSAQIRDLGAQVLRESGGDPLTAAEIRQLTEIALGCAREVESYAARLAELTEGRP